MKVIFQEGRHVPSFATGRYSNEAVFVAILSQQGDQYDREIVGEAIYDEIDGFTDFGVIDPPGTGVGYYINSLLEDWDFELDSAKWSVSDIKQNLDLVKFMDDLKSNMGGFFIFEADSEIFREISYETFAEFVSQDDGKMQIQVVEFEGDS